MAELGELELVADAEADNFNNNVLCLPRSDEVSGESR